MSAKSYIKEIMNKNNKQAEELKEESKSRENAYTVGAVATGIIGIVTTFINPWFGIPMLTLAGSFYLGKKRNQKIKQASVNRLTGENNHLNNILKNGIKTGKEVTEKRINQINSLSDIKKEQDSKWQKSLSGTNLANGIVCCSAAVAMFFGGPLLTAIPVLGLVYKYHADKKYAEVHNKLQETYMNLNNNIYDHNITCKIMTEKQMNNNVNEKTTVKTNNPAKTKQTVKTNDKVNINNYSEEDIKAVEDYLRSLDNEKQKEKGYQKKKI